MHFIVFEGKHLGLARYNGTKRTFVPHQDLSVKITPNQMDTSPLVNHMPSSLSFKSTNEFKHHLPHFKESKG